MVHLGQTLAEFQDGETRLIYARQRGASDLWLLPDGTAAEHRERTKRELLCPVAECPTPALTTVSRWPKRRDGFRHLVDGNHPGERLFHVQAKARIMAWVRERYRLSRVKDEEKSNDARERVADVMVTGPTGKRMAIEIQYSNLTPEEWLRRHESYVDQGIIDVWLFGHHGEQLRRPRGEHDPEVVALNPTHQLVVASGLPLLWFNPITAQVATASQRGMLAWRPFEVPASGKVGRFEIEELDAFALGLDGLTSARTRQLTENAAQLVREREEAARQAEIAALDAAAALKAEEERVERARAAWLLTPEYAKALADFGGNWPEWLSVDIQPRLPLPVEQWQSYAFLTFIKDRGHGNRVRAEGVVRGLTETFGLRRAQVLAANGVVLAWLRVLAEHGVLLMQPHANPRVFSFLVVNQEQEARRQLRLARAAEIADRHRAVLQAAERAARAADPLPRPAPPAKAETLTCTVCRLPLDPMWARWGYHGTCAPGWAAQGRTPV